MKKYLFLSDGKSPHTLKWIQEIHKYYNVYIISFNGFSKAIFDLLGKQKCFDYSIDIKSDGNNYKYLFNLKKITKDILDINPNIVNAHYLTSYGFVASLIKKIYIKDMFLISSAWGTDILVTPSKNFIYKFLAKFILKNSNLVTSDSFFMTDKIKNIYNHPNVLSFPFGVEESINKNINKENLIFSNRALYKNYNISDIILWFSKIQDNNYKLVIANDGNLKKDLLILVEQLKLRDKISFVGFLTKEEQNYYYNIAKYYISIPSSDSTSVSLLEAMNYGCIPILSNIPANREWIIDKHNGLFFTNNLLLLEFNKDIIKINQDIIKKRAIFRYNIEYFKNIITEMYS